jgi:hypothetical protein
LLGTPLLSLRSCSCLRPLSFTGNMHLRTQPADVPGKLGDVFTEPPLGQLP